MSVIFPPAILEMAAPILRAPGIFWSFLLENPHAHKSSRFRGPFLLEGGGVGSANFFLWAFFCCNNFGRDGRHLTRARHMSRELSFGCLAHTWRNPEGYKEEARINLETTRGMRSQPCMPGDVVASDSTTVATEFLATALIPYIWPRPRFLPTPEGPNLEKNNLA